MDNTWWKFYRKLIEHPVFHDDKALKLFLYILSTANYKTGTLRTSRFRTAESVKMKPPTFQKVLKRLEEKYEIVSLRSNNKWTEISVLNWAKYQQDEDPLSPLVSSKYHQSINKVSLNKNIDNTVPNGTVFKKEKMGGAGGFATPTAPAFPLKPVSVASYEPLDRWAHKGETTQEKKVREFWQQASKEQGIPVDELMKRIK